MTTQEQTRPFRKTFRCKRLRLLEHLRRNGFSPTSTIPEPESGGRYLNWIFEGSPELEDCIDSYVEACRARAKEL